MNTYKIDGYEYKATNDYNAAKIAYAGALKIRCGDYLGMEKWEYTAYFENGQAHFTVQRVN